MDTQKLQPHMIEKIKSIALVSLVLGLCFNYFLYGQEIGLGFSLYIVAILAGIIGLFVYTDKKISLETVLLVCLTVFFASMVSVRASVLLTFLNVVASILLLLLISKTALSGKVKSFSIRDYFKLSFLPATFISTSLKMFPYIFARRTGEQDKTSTGVLRGILITLPILFIFACLFYSADLVFQSYIDSIFNFNIDGELVFRTILVFVVSMVSLGAFGYLFSRTELKEEQKTKEGWLGNIETSILLVSVNVLFLTFILVQLVYLFGGDTNIVSLGFTYAEYARKGFFQLIFISVISFILLMTTERIVKKTDMQHSMLFKTLNSVFILQIFVIMISAFKRLSLYESAYGFTTMRLYSHAFIVFLAVIFICLLYKIIKNKKDTVFVFQIFVCVNLFLFSMNVLNPDAFIARKNVERFEEAGKIDMDYVTRLSSDAIPELAKFFTILDRDTRADLGFKLREFELRRAKEPHSYYNRTWQSYNMSARYSEKILEPLELQQYETYPSIDRKMSEEDLDY